MSTNDVVEQYKTLVTGYLDRNPFLNDLLEPLSKHTSVDKATLAFACIFIPIILILAFFSFGLVVDLLGFIYPFVASIKALKTEGKDDDEQWLTYWIIYNVFKMVEVPFDMIISIIPFYHLLKVCYFIA
jgi:receptor expression-enhancing protein 5/6